MDSWLKNLLDEVKQGLGELYGSRLRGLYLFGSYARGEEGSESDVDLLIVLDTLPNYVYEIQRTGELFSSLSLRHDLSISRVFVSESNWCEGGGPFLQNVRQDAVAA